MSIRLRLILSYFLLIIISLMILVGGLIVTTGRMMEAFGSRAFGDNSFSSVVTTVMDTMVDLEYMRRHEQQLFSDTTQMAEVEAGITDMNMALFVEQNGKLVYESEYKTYIRLSDFLDELVFDGDQEDGIEIADFEDGNRFFIVGRWDISTEGDDHIYLVYEAISRGQFHWNLYGGMYQFVGAVVILLLVALTLIITRSVIKPLNRLEEATNEIRQGNLAFSLKTSKKDEFGRVMNAFDTMREELKNSIEQQVQYEENRKELIASISHDLKTPITSIKGYVEGIRDGVASDEEKMNQYLDVIYHKSIDMDKLIDDLFMFSKLDLKRVPFDFAVVNAKRFFEDSCDELRIDVGKHGFEFNDRIELMEETAIRVDRQQFRRVMINIINNAVKYSDGIKRIDLHVSEVQGRIRLAIKDYGKGIDQASRERIFDKFYRADPARNQEVAGSGLGLAIAKEIIIQHNGTITAESSIGEGTTITIEIGRAEYLS